MGEGKKSNSSNSLENCTPHISRVGFKGMEKMVNHESARTGKKFALNIHVEPKMVYGTERRIYKILRSPLDLREGCYAPLITSIWTAVVSTGGYGDFL